MYPICPSLSTPPAPEVDNTLLNIYEESPCLGVLSEAVCASISNNQPEPYVSHVTYEGAQPTANLLGFRPLEACRQT